MKTIDKNYLKKKGTSKKGVNRYLIEDPSGHHLFSKSALSRKVSILSDLIQLKTSKDKKNKSTSLLISSISLCLSFLFVIGMFEWRIKENGSSVNLELKSQSFDNLLEIPQTEQVQKPPIKAQAPVIIEVKDDEIIEEIEINLDIEMTEETRIEAVIIEQVKESMPEEKVDEIFTIVEVQPTPVGGMKTFYDYVGGNLQYPHRAKRMGIEGRVFVNFVVEKDGSLTDIRVVKGIGGGCDEEAIRVISQAPKWNPGKQRGRAVRVRMVMPLLFKILS
ncbi:MAG: energy transducer TonB [Cyclobacteriaceae bacterium]|nr:energy transducer TonB [Cyclobacteriaceae bacterium]MCK5278353.1 energy transducer TonB [Cyclobacteriaceae bacterium]